MTIVPAPMLGILVKTGVGYLTVSIRYQFLDGMATTWATATITAMTSLRLQLRVGGHFWWSCQRKPHVLHQRLDARNCYCRCLGSRGWYSSTSLSTKFPTFLAIRTMSPVWSATDWALVSAIRFVWMRLHISASDNEGPSWGWTVSSRACSTTMNKANLRPSIELK